MSRPLLAWSAILLAPLATTGRLTARPAPGAWWVVPPYYAGLYVPSPGTTVATVGHAANPFPAFCLQADRLGVIVQVSGPSLGGPWIRSVDVTAPSLIALAALGVGYLLLRRACPV